MAGLSGEQSAPVVPMPISPTDSPTMRNWVVCVKMKAHRSVMAPRLVTTMGASAVLNWASGASPISSSLHWPDQVC